MVPPRGRLRTLLPFVSLPLVLLCAPGPVRAQSPEESQGPDEAETAPAPKPPPRKPKPKPKPVPQKPAPQKAAPAEPIPAKTPSPEAAPAAPVTPPAAAPAAKPAPVPMPAANLPGLTVQCEARAALYEGPKAFALWVTRTGVAVAENPLRPLTPETTRVLQVVIGAKAATAYGPDLFALRRGGSPRALEGMLGAPIRWDAVATALPDTLNIVSETGQSLAQLGFRECGEAPAVAAPPVAAQDRPKDRPKAKPKVRAKAPAEDGARDPSRQEPAQRVPPGLKLPQGIIP